MCHASFLSQNFEVFREPDLDRSMNRQNQLTIQPRALNCSRAILSILSIFRLARLRSKDRVLAQLVFFSISFFFSLSTFLSNANHPLSPLSPPRVSYLSISLSTAKTRRCNVTKRTLSERIVYLEIEISCQSYRCCRFNGILNIKRVQDTIKTNIFLWKLIFMYDVYIYGKKNILFEKTY